MKSLVTAVGLCAALTLLSRSDARAQETSEALRVPPPVMAPPLPSTPPPPPPVVDVSSASEERLDWMMPVSAGSLVFGGVLMLGGAITFAVEVNDEYCGRTGCVERPNLLGTTIGASLLGAGLGFAVVGGFGMIGWTANAPRGTETRTNDALMSVGLGTVATAGASLGIGVAHQVLAHDGVDVSAFPFFLASGLLSAVGIPMLVAGAGIVTDADREAERQRELALNSPEIPQGMYSPGMVIGGGIVTGIGAVAGLAGTVTIIVDATSLHSYGLVSAAVGFPLLGGGGLLCAIGVPLVAVGAKTEPKYTKKGLGSVPTVDVGPTGLRASWSLE